MMRTVTIKVEVVLTVKADEGVSMPDLINEMEYDFTSTTDGADIEDTEIRGFEVTDSR